MTTLTAPRQRVSPLPRRADQRSRRWRWLFPVLIASLLALVAVSVIYGTNFTISPADFVGVLSGSDSVGPLAELGVQSRLPRALLAIVVGAALAVAGALLQALTRNPLASPDIIGVSQGVVVAVLAVTLWFPALPFGLVGWISPLCGLVGGLGTAAVIALATRRLGAADSTQFILIGILVGGVLASISSLALIMLGSDATLVFGFLSGTLNLKSWSNLWTASAYLVPGLLLTLTAVPRANAMQLGEDVAIGLGQRRGRDRSLVLLTSVLLTTGAVTVVGGMAFVGLMAPHIARRFVGSNQRRLIPASALVGAHLVLVCDLLARNLQPQRIGWGEELGPAYLPVGVYLALFGVPFMISLLWRRKG